MNKLPSVMRSVNISEYGPAENLHIVESALPSFRADEVLIKVKAAGVSRPDIYQRLGLYPQPPGASNVLGLEVSGEVVAIGDQVTKWQVGDAVCALLTGGGYAEYAVTSEKLCLSIPEPLGFIEAAGIPEAFFTVWRNLFDIAELSKGDTLLVHGGASGIGTTAIQIAKEMGVTVYTTAGSEEKCTSCERLGAEMAINYKENDFADVVEEAVGKHGVNVILDIVGGDYIQRNLRLAAVGARIVYIGFLQNSTAEVDFLPMMLKNVKLTGSTLRGQTTQVKGAIAMALQKHIWPMLEQGTIAPIIYQSLPFTEVVRAHQMIESSDHVGKVILTFE